MAEKIKIFELDIDVDAALKAQSNLAKTVDDLKAKMVEAEYTVGKNSEQYIELEARLKNTRKEYNAAQTQIGKLLKLQGKEIKTVEQGRNALTILNKEWARQAQLYGENSKEADELAKKHKELKDRVNELQKGVGDTSGNIGRYAEGMQEAISRSSYLAKAQGALNDVVKVGSPIFNYLRGQLRGISKDFSDARKNMQGYTVAQKASATATTYTSAALRLLKVALISTGIGAIIVLIGTLVAWFSKTQKGIDLVNKVLAVLGAAFDVIIDRIAKVGGALIKFFSGDFAGAWSDLKDSAKGFGDELAREIVLAYKLEQQLQNLRKEQILLDFRRSAANTRIKELNKLIEDTTQKTEDRIAAAKELEKIESELAKAEQMNAEAALLNKLGKLEADEESIKLLRQLKEGTVEYDTLLKKIGLSESTEEDVKELLELFQKAEEAQQRSFEVRTTNQNKLNTLLQEEKRNREAAEKAAIQAAQKATDAAIKESKVKLQLFIEENKDKAQSLQEQLKFAEDKRDKELEILKAELDAKKLTQSEYELAVLKSKNEFLKTQKDITVQFAEEELDVIKKSYQSRIEQGQLLNDTLVSQEQSRLDRIAEAEREFQAKRLEEGVISQKEYNDAIADIDLESKQKKDELEAEYAQQKAEAAAIDLENQRILDEEKLNYDLGLQLQYLEKQKQQEIEAAEAKGADVSLIQQKYAAIEEQLRAVTEANKSQLASQTFGNLVTIMGKESKAGKAFAVAQTTIDTYQSATAAYKAMAGIPIVGPALGAIAAAAAVVSGIANVKKITSTPEPKIPKAEKGALFDIGGKRHSAGGTQFYGEDGTRFEAEQGELIGVMNRRAAMAFKAFNDSYPYSSSTENYLAGGGFVQTSSAQSAPTFIKSQSEIDYEMMAKFIGREVGEANRQLPRPLTDVKDIIGNVNDYNDVVNGANL